jgi:predicted nucleic acid-binding protein
MIGLDTCAIIDLFKGDTRLAPILKDNKEPLVSTILNYSELTFGIDPSKKKHSEELDCYEKIFDEIRTLGLTKETCKEASRIYWQLRDKGKTVEKADCMIAAILLSNGIQKILTRNTKHFKDIPGVKVLTY